MKTVRVALGVVRDSEQRVLLSRRAEYVHQGGKWEFPGGKLEPGESYKSALRRELKEELGIDIVSAALLISFSHRYDDLEIFFQVFNITSYAGEVLAGEGQRIVWTPLANLENYEFPDANIGILHALRLPQSYLITPDNLPRAQLMAGIDKSLQEGVKLVQLRNNQLSKTDYKDYAQELFDMCERYKADLILNCPIDWLLELPLLPVHLTSKRMREVVSDIDAGEKLDLFSVSCHDEHEIELANGLLPRCILLGPVLKTKTHPQSKPIGWPSFHHLVMKSKLPVYALGGMSLEDICVARCCGGQGIAAIRSFVA